MSQKTNKKKVQFTCTIHRWTVQWNYPDFVQPNHALVTTGTNLQPNENLQCNVSQFEWKLYTCRN